MMVLHTWSNWKQTHCLHATDFDDQMDGTGVASIENNKLSVDNIHNTVEPPPPLSPQLKELILLVLP